MSKIINLNSLSKSDFELVIQIAKRYSKPKLVQDIILDLEEEITEFNEDRIKRIIRKLREAPITEPR